MGPLSTRKWARIGRGFPHTTLSRLCSAEQLLTVTPLGWRVVERLRQAHDGQTAVTPSRLAKPEWRATARQLWYGHCLLKVYRRHAPNQMILLDAFQQAGWPTWMASPFSCDPFDDEMQLLRDTIKNVNRGHRHRLLRFVIDARCRYVGWRFMPRGK